MSINPTAGPVPSPADPPYPATGPGPARAHVRRLRQDGSTYRGIATAAGLDRATVSDLARGRRRPTHGTITAVLAVTSKSVLRGRVDAGGTRLRLRALHVMGHGSARIARALGIREMTIRQIVRGDTRTISLNSATTSPTCTTPGATDAPPPAPGSTAAPPPPPANAPSPGTGAPPPPSTTPSSTPPTTGPGTAGNPPPAPVSPPRSALVPAAAEDPPMTRDHLITPGLTADMLDTLNRNGYVRGDDLHAERAIGLIGDLARIYEGAQDYPAYPITVPSPPTYPGPSRHRCRHPHSRRRLHCVRRAGHRRRRQALPRRCAPTAPTSPAPPARPTSTTPRPSTRWPTASSRPPEPTRCQRQPARASRRPQAAADREAGRVTRSRRKPARPATGPAATPLIPGPRAGEQGHAGNRRTLRPAVSGPMAAPPEVRDRRRPAPRLAARPAALPGRTP